jgi:predicted site-specific integrase-resolvase
MPETPLQHDEQDAGRSADEAARKVAFWAPASTVDRLDDIARQVRRSRSDTLRLLIEEATPSLVRRLR